MKLTHSNTLLKASALTALLSTSLSSQTVMADVSANVGVVSQYHFRGIQQTTSASASAGLDYEEGAFSIGTWAADVNDGLEIDFYGSYGFELDNGVSLSVGATTYQYTGDFDSAYNEVNFGAGFGKFSIGYSVGSWDGEVGNETATESEYTIFLTLAFKHNGFTTTFGTYGDEADGEYCDVVYGTKIGEFDVGVGILISGSDLDDDESLYFSFGKSFGL